MLDQRDPESVGRNLLLLRKGNPDLKLHQIQDAAERMGIDLSKNIFDEVDVSMVMHQINGNGHGNGPTA